MGVMGMAICNIFTTSLHGSMYHIGNKLHSTYTHTYGSDQQNLLLRYSTIPNLFPFFFGFDDHVWLSKSFFVFINFSIHTYMQESNFFMAS